LQSGGIDIPTLVLTATIWVYWFAVGAMVIRARRKTRQLAGLVPEQPLERRMWLLLVPTIHCLPSWSRSPTARLVNSGSWPGSTPLWRFVTWVLLV
jgi:hypothetical protein